MMHRVPIRTTLVLAFLTLILIQAAENPAATEASAPIASRAMSMPSVKVMGISAAT